MKAASWRAAHRAMFAAPQHPQTRALVDAVPAVPPERCAP